MNGITLSDGLAVALFAILSVITPTMTLAHKMAWGHPSICSRRMCTLLAIACSAVALWISAGVFLNLFESWGGFGIAVCLILAVGVVWASWVWGIDGTKALLGIAVLTVISFAKTLADLHIVQVTTSDLIAPLWLVTVLFLAIGLLWAWRTSSIEAELLNRLRVLGIVLAAASLIGVLVQMNTLQPWQWAVAIGLTALVAGITHTVRDPGENGWALLVGAGVFLVCMLIWGILTARDAMVKFTVTGLNVGELAGESSFLVWIVLFIVLFVVMFMALEGKSRSVESGAHAASRPHGLMATTAALTASYVAIGGYLFFTYPGDLGKFGMLLGIGAALGFMTVLTGYIASSSYGKAGSTSKVSLFDAGVFGVGVAWLRLGAFVWPFIAAVFTWWKP